MTHELKKVGCKNMHNEINKKFRGWNTTKNAERKNFFAEQKFY